MDIFVDSFQGSFWGQNVDNFLKVLLDVSTTETPLIDFQHFFLSGKKKRILAASHFLTHKASTTLSHCAFLCTVLSEVTEYHSLAFRVGMFGIEMTRLPASTKPMEVNINKNFNLLL